MKKLLVLLVTVSTMVVFAACTGNQKKDDQQGTQAPTQEEGNGEETPDNSSLSSVIDEIYAKKDPGLALQTMEIDLKNADIAKTFTGLEDVSGVKEAVASEAAIGSQAYSLVLVEVQDEAKAAEIAEKMFNGIDTRKWICVEADELSVAVKGSRIMLIMMQSDFEGISASDIVGAFKEVSGGSVDKEFTK